MAEKKEPKKEGKTQPSKEKHEGKLNENKESKTAKTKEAREQENKGKEIKKKEEEKKARAKKKPIDKKAAAKAYEILRYPLITEKAVNMIETENKLVFIVDKKSKKQDVKKAVEMLFNVEVDRVNILKDMKNRKRAFVKINKKYKADDIATKLGVL